MVSGFPVSHANFEMANTKQAQKYIRKSESRRQHNRTIRSRLKTINRKFDSLQGSDDPTALSAAARELVSAYDRAAKRGIVHRNRAAEKKAKVARYLS
mgnify:CR=1 FL=1